MGQWLWPNKKTRETVCQWLFASESSVSQLTSRQSQTWMLPFVGAPARKLAPSRRKQLSHQRPKKCNTSACSSSGKSERMREMSRFLRRQISTGLPSGALAAKANGQ